jgi:choline kinase
LVENEIIDTQIAASSLMADAPPAKNIPKCVVLAAGASTRLRPLTDAIPKCLLDVNGKTLLERTVENVLAVGINEISIVVGYRSEMIREFVKRRFPQQRIRLILNPNYAKTNNAYSLLLARRFLEDANGNMSYPLLLLDSDILFSGELLPALVQFDAKNKIAVRVLGRHDEEEIRVKVNANGSIVLIGKDIPLTEIFGESIGIEIFSSNTAAQLFATLEHHMRYGAGRTEFYEASFQEMIDSGTELTSVDISTFPAIEIDTIDDLERAKQLPMI